MLTRQLESGQCVHDSVIQSIYGDLDYALDICILEFFICILPWKVY